MTCAARPPRSLPLRCICTLHADAGSQRRQLQRGCAALQAARRLSRWAGAVGGACQNVSAAALRCVSEGLAALEKTRLAPPQVPPQHSAAADAAEQHPTLCPRTWAAARGPTWRAGAGNSAVSPAHSSMLPVQVQSGRSQPSGLRRPDAAAESAPRGLVVRPLQTLAVALACAGCGCGGGAAPLPTGRGVTCGQHGSASERWCWLAVVVLLQRRERLPAAQVRRHKAIAPSRAARGRPSAPLSPPLLPPVGPCRSPHHHPHRCRAASAAPSALTPSAPCRLLCRACSTGPQRECAGAGLCPSRPWHARGLGTLGDGGGALLVIDRTPGTHAACRRSRSLRSCPCTFCQARRPSRALSVHTRGRRGAPLGFSVPAATLRRTLPCAAARLRFCESHFGCTDTRLAPVASI
jgi:hypothetical protein